MLLKLTHCDDGIKQNIKITGQIIKPASDSAIINIAVALINLECNRDNSNIPV